MKQEQTLRSVIKRSALEQRCTGNSSQNPLDILVR